MAWKQISEYASTELKRHSYVNYDVDQECYFVDFYQDDNYITSERYPGKSIHFAEDAAENYAIGILNVPQTA